MLIAEDLKDLLITNLSGLTDASTALSTLGSSLSSYTKDNAVVNFSWTGINPSGDPDPTTTTTGEIVSLDISLTPSMATVQPIALLFLTTEIKTYTALGNYNITSTGFTTSPSLLSTSPNINTFVLTINADNQPEAMLQLAQAYILYITSQVPTGVCAGSRGSYIGTGVVTSII